MNVVLSLLVVVCLFGCQSTSEIPVPPKSSKFVEKMPVVRVSGKFNVDKAIKKIHPTRSEKEIWFTIIDNKNGYAEMTGYMEGSIEYFLFVGHGKNLLVEVTWGCGPACEQVVNFYEILPKRSAKVSFRKIVDSKFFSKYESEFVACLSSNSFNSWSNDRCGIMLEFEREGTQVGLYRASSFEDGKFGNSVGQATPRLEQLLWSRKGFKFSKRGSKP